jgi:hypothetical protein
VSESKTIIRVESPKTQSVEAVKALLAWKGRASDPLPSFIEMGEGESRLVLVLSNKKDCYYVTTARDCSCPARSWHPNQPCKHQRKYFAEQTIHKQSIEETLREADKNLHKMPYQYQRMVKAAREAAEAEPSDIIPHKPFRPFIEDEERSPAKAPSIPLVDTLPDPTARDIAYHSIKADREFWPMVEA